jgi:hypothetical protein
MVKEILLGEKVLPEQIRVLYSPRNPETMVLRALSGKSFNSMNYPGVSPIVQNGQSYEKW